MICPACGTTMNHHADKLEYGEGVTAESSWGGVVMEVQPARGAGMSKPNAAPS